MLEVRRELVSHIVVEQNGRIREVGEEMSVKPVRFERLEQLPLYTPGQPAPEPHPAFLCSLGGPIPYFSGEVLGIVAESRFLLGYGFRTFAVQEVTRSREQQVDPATHVKNDRGTQIVTPRIRAFILGDNRAAVDPLVDVVNRGPQPIGIALIQRPLDAVTASVIRREP